MPPYLSLAVREWSVSLFISSIPLHSLMVDWRFSRGITEQTEALHKGLYEVVQREWLQLFDERELEVSAQRSGCPRHRTTTIVCVCLSHINNPARCLFTQLLLSGMPEMDIVDWEKHTVYLKYNRQSKQIVWFWKVSCVSEFQCAPSWALVYVSPTHLRSTHFKWALSTCLWS